ncbi:MAG TPA: TonB-dependent receptor [Acidobacteriaceae bacterium]|nr:TonB-dependent receptor [Acidobacteriaceae bacterium]
MTIRGTTAASVLAGLLLFAATLSAFAQETRATLGGKVTDPNGAVIQHATVTVTSKDTGVAQTTTTNSVGEWTVQYLLPGHYRFQVSAPSFKAVKYADIELQVNDNKTINTQLPIGAQNETVTVDTTTPLIDTTAAVAGTVITETEMQELPNLSNAPTALIGLTPGASTSTGVGGGVFLWSNSGLSGNAVNGTGATTGATQYTNSATNYKLDGGTDTNNDGQIAYEPPSDAVHEFRVVTNAYDAAIGRQSGATISLVSRTGTSKYHGDVYEYNQNNLLNANTYAYDASGTPKAPIHVNNFGATFGGPLSIPKLYDGAKRGTFFFLSYSGIRNIAPINQGYATVPTPLERQGDFSQSYVVSAGVQYPVNIYDPNTTVATNSSKTAFTRTQFPGNKLTRIDPVAKALMAMIPLPDSPAQTAISNNANNYLKKEEQNDKFETYMLRLDQAWNNKNHSFVNLRQNHWDEITNDPFGPTFFLNTYLQTRVNKGVTLDHTITITNNLLLDLNYNFVRYVSNTRSGAAGSNPNLLGFSPTYIAEMKMATVPLFENIVPGAEDNGLGTDNGGSPTADTNQDFNVNLTQVHKNHTFRYGAEYMIQQEAKGGVGAVGGTFTFGTNWTRSSPVGTVATGSGDVLADFLLGLPNGGSIPNNASSFWSQHYTGFYVQDDWKVNRQLTLNMGLRWDYQRPVSERFNRLSSRFDPNYVQTGVTTPAQGNYAALLSGSASGDSGLACCRPRGPIPPPSSPAARCCTPA